MMRWWTKEVPIYMPRFWWVMICVGLISSGIHGMVNFIGAVT